MSKLSNIINQLAAIGSTLKKQEILESNKDLPELKLTFWLAEEPSINFYIRVDPTDVADGTEELTADLLMDVHNKLALREVTGNAARAYVNELLQQLTADDGKILCGIINRDLDCKVGTGIVNKVWVNLIKNMPCMLASKMDEKAAKSIVKLTNGYFIQKKCDGSRVMAVVSKKGGVEFLSRNGKPVQVHGVFDQYLSHLHGMMLDGEFLVDAVAGVENRQTGNGIFNKAVRNTITPDEAARFRFVVWDIIPVDDMYAGYCSEPYESRFNKLSSIVSEIKAPNIELVESEIVSTLDECYEFYSKMIQEGEEGAILKVASAPWEDKRSKSVIKLKEELDIDAECFDVVPHNKKPSWIGALKCRTRDGLVIFDVGSGLTDEDRQKEPGFYIGKIIECKYNAVVSNQGNSIKSLFLPIFQRVRFDKSVANSLEELK